ncbi:MAG: hypothetical protein GWP10_21130 [Nitrospiraceae bacterium]|nr:hypothetical protein [Nitrospiraceae bacterium]
MKVSVDDDTGSRVIAVLKLDGTPAVEGEDYVLWSGEYHKNGKWSYTEGGIALKNGIYIVNERSTHTSANNQRWMHMVKDNKEICYHHVMGRAKETPERPKCPSDIDPVVWVAVIQAVIDFLDPEKAESMIAGWEKMEKFV